MINKESPILAKPSGITLDVHAENVIQEGALLLKGLGCTKEKYFQTTAKQIVQRVELACKYHDIGKRNKIWQDACKKDYKAYLIWKKIHPNKSFEDYTIECREEAGKFLRQTHVRHEFYSIKGLLNNNPPPNNNPPYWLKIAIAAHHRKLSMKHEERWLSSDEDICSVWKDIRRLSNYFFDDRNSVLSDIAIKQYEFAGPRSLLQLADHRASAKEESKCIPDPIAFSYTFPEKWEKRPVQKLVEKHWRDELLLVRAPTGAGKTDAALLWASHQIKHRKADRLIIAMPTRFTTNALALSVSSTLSSTGLYHSSAWTQNFSSKIDNGEIALEQARYYHNQARLLQTPITVCTIDHLLSSLTLCDEEHQTITFALANACLVIDEADFYDQFTQANILVLLEVLKYWKVPILLMSASLPDNIVQEYRKIGYDIKHILEDTSDIERARFSLIEKRDVSEISQMQDLLQLCLDRGSAIIFANTVDRAQAYYQWFLENGHEEEVILYHSRYTETDKIEKEAQLLLRLGRSAWDNDRANGVAILTQIGEMSVNISADIMISDLCPFDRLTQRCGRLCRFSRKIGDLYIIRPMREGNLFPAPYYQNVGPSQKLEPNDALIQTDELLEKGMYSAANLVQLLNKVYANQTVFSTEASRNADRLREMFKANWLINPIEYLDEEIGSTNFWRARNIMPRCRIYIKRPLQSFRNYSDFRRWETDVAIDIPIYVIKKAMRMSDTVCSQVKVCIGKNDYTLIVINAKCYNNVRGLFFSESVLEEPNFEFL